MLKKYIQILSNPLLYYSTKDGNSVFRNFSLFNQTGCRYSKIFEKPNIGKALEYRIGLENRYHLYCFLTIAVLYLLFIHIKFSIFALLFFEIVGIIIIMSIRLKLSYKYHNYLLACFGEYESIEFEPPINERKKEEYLALFRSKIILTVICIALFLLPSLLLSFGIKHSLTPKHNGYKHAIVMSNIYNFIYPKNPKIYDMRAVAHYMQRDYEAALKDYKKALDLSGKRFTKDDITRFENLLLLQKRITSSHDAVDIFNEYITKKKMSILEEAQMLWIKSIFKIENSIIDSILQDYDDLLSSLNPKDTKNQFYISCDKAYMLYLMQMYDKAINAYNALIDYAQENEKIFSKELQSLYAERGWAKKRLGDNAGASIDFNASKIPPEKLPEYEPQYQNQQFVNEK